MYLSIRRRLCCCCCSWKRSVVDCPKSLFVNNLITMKWSPFKWMFSSIFLSARFVLKKWTYLQKRDKHRFTAIYDFNIHYILLNVLIFAIDYKLDGQCSLGEMHNEASQNVVVISCCCFLRQNVIGQFNQHEGSHNDENESSVCAATQHHWRFLVDI